MSRDCYAYVAPGDYDCIRTLLCLSRAHWQMELSDATVLSCHTRFHMLGASLQFCAINSISFLALLCPRPSTSSWWKYCGWIVISLIWGLLHLIFPTDNHTNPILPQTKLSNGLNSTRTVIMLLMHSPLTGLVVLVSRQIPRSILLDLTVVQEVSPHLQLHQPLISMFLAKIPTQCLPSLI